MVHGRSAKKGEFPFQVCLEELIEEEEVHFCGGAIIDKYHFLTAAHCLSSFKENFENLRAIVGDLNLHGECPNRFATPLDQLYPHEEFEDDFETGYHDIALVRVKEPFVFSDHVQPIPIRSTEPIEGEECSVSGWGNAKFKYFWRIRDYYPENLHAANLKITDMALCKDIYNEKYSTHISDGMLCAFSGRKKSCEGDSGGPLVCSNELTGLVSWGFGCKRWDTTPEIYTNIYFYRDWILKMLTKSYKDGRLPLS